MAQMFTNGLMDKLIVLYPYDGMLSCPKKEWRNDTCHNMDESQKRYAKYKKPDTKVVIYSIYVKYSK